MGMKKEEDHMMVIYDEKRESQTENEREKKNDIDNSFLDFIIIISNRMSDSCFEV